MTGGDGAANETYQSSVRFVLCEAVQIETRIDRQEPASEPLRRALVDAGRGARRQFGKRRFDGGRGFHLRRCAWFCGSRIGQGRSGGFRRTRRGTATGGTN